MQPVTAGKHLIPDLPSAEELLPYLRRIDAARYYSNFGPLVREFEEKLQSLLRARDPCPEFGEICVAAVASEYGALEIGLRLLGIGPGKRVFVPAITFVASPLAVERMGADAVLADVDHDTWRLGAQSAHAAAERMRIDAVMPVATYGVPVPIDPWDEFSRDTGIAVLIDAAAAFEVQVVPRYGLVAHSFHATKPLGIGEGGALITRDSALIERARRYSNFGLMDGIAQVDGTNSKMSEYHAAVGLAQLERWTDIKLKRSRLLASYLTKLASISEVAEPQRELAEAIPYLLMVLLKRPVATEVAERAKRVGLAAHRTYLPPLYSHSRFQHLMIVNAEGFGLPAHVSTLDKCAHMPTAEWLSARLLGLPFHHLMSESDVATTVGTLRRLADAPPTPTLSPEPGGLAYGRMQL